MILDIDKNKMYMTIQHNGVGQFHLVGSHRSDYQIHVNCNDNYTISTEEEIRVFMEILKDYRSEIKSFTLNYCNQLRDSNKTYNIKGKLK